MRSIFLIFFSIFQEQIVQGSCACPIPEGFQGQVGEDFNLPDLE